MAEIIELVQLEAKGIDEIDAKLERLVKQQENAADRQERLLRVMNDPRWQAAKRKADDLKQTMQAIEKANKGAAEASKQHITNMQRLTSMGRMAGGALAAAGISVGIAGNVRAGFSGTVEGNRLSNEVKLIQRELAAAFLPAMKWLTNTMRSVRQNMEALGGNGQTAVAAGLTAIGGYGAYRAAGFVGNINRAATVMASGGTGSAVAGGVASGAAGGAAARGGMLARGGPYALAGTAAVAGTVGSLSSPGGAADLANQMGIGGKTGAILSGLTRMGPVGVLNDLAHGRKPSIMGIGAAMAVGDNPELMKKFGGEEFAKAYGKGSGHRKVTEADAGIDEIGSGYERVAQAVALQSAQDIDDGKGGKPNNNTQERSLDMLKIIADRLNEIATNGLKNAMGMTW